MSEPFAFDLRVIDVEGNLIVDPSVFVRVANDAHSVVAQLAFNQAVVGVRFDNRPGGDTLQLRLTPSRYHDSRIFCLVNGDKTIVPPELQIPRRSSEWLPLFDKWADLGEGFGLLKKKLKASLSFRLGRTSDPEQLIEDRYDAVLPEDESRSIAKMALLNLYSRFGFEPAPGTTTMWFEFVNDLCYSTRERFVAEIDEECFSRVHKLTKKSEGGYKGVNVAPGHIKNLEAIPGVTDVSKAASVKTKHPKANLQLTVARAKRDGRSVFLVDADMDENGRLILHAFDLIKHAFNGGTHPIDIGESLRVMFPESLLGYGLSPKNVIPETSVRLVS
jgi:hypothetical protein